LLQPLFFLVKRGILLTKAPSQWFCASSSEEGRDRGDEQCTHCCYGVGAIRALVSPKEVVALRHLAVTIFKFDPDVGGATNLEFFDALVRPR